MLWTDRFPGRLEYELDDFCTRGLENFELNLSELERGRVVVEGVKVVDGEEIGLRVVYPDLFPYFRPEVYALDLELGRHQNPYDRNLCLLEAPTRAWRTTETGAWLVDERVPYLLGLLRDGGDALFANEVPQGEPTSFYVPRLHATAVLLPTNALELPADVDAGTLYFSFRSDRVGPAIHVLLRQINGWVKSGGGRPLATAEDELQQRFEGPKIEGRWVRLDSCPGRDPEAYFAAAESVRPGFGSPPWQRIGNDRVAILGVVFREEIQQGVSGDAWMFAVRYQQAQPRQAGHYLTKGDRFAREDLGARIPRITPLAGRRVALIGLGSLGAPLALELARSQLGELRTLDFDLVEAGTIVRWPAGVPAIGSAKTSVIAGTIANQYPYTHCTSIDRHLGSTQERDDNDYDVLDGLLDGCDLVIEATGEIAIQHLIRDLAHERGLPQIYVWSTEGAYGGVVARAQPGVTGCWFCLQLAIEDGTIEAPPRERTGTTQPRGCGMPTFTGESFNLLPIVAQAARTTSAVLLNEVHEGEDVLVASLRDGERAAPAPRWTTYELGRHSNCPYCTND
jgi:hypothetical protein